MVSVANALSADNRAKTWLVVFAPAVSIIVNYGWGYLKNFIDDEVGKWRADRALAEAIAFNDKILQDPEATEADKDEARLEKSSLRRLQQKAKKSRFRAMIDGT